MQKDHRITFITLWKLNDWGMYNRRDEALLKELSRREEVESVLHVEHVSLKSLLCRMKEWLVTKEKSFRHIYKTHIRKGLALRPVPAGDKGKVYIYSVVVCYNGNQPFLKKISGFITSLQYWSINKHFEKRGNVVLIAYPPLRCLPEAIKLIKHDLLIGDFEDDVLERTDDPVKKKQADYVYRYVLPKCEWIFSTSPDMDRRYREYARQKIDCLPNGVDLHLYSVGSSEVRMKNNGNKVIGYAGNLNKSIDADLLEYVVASHPQVTFMIIGHADSRKYEDMIDRMERDYDNFRFLGKRHFLDIPDNLKKCDVLINFKKNDNTTAGGDSQKIYEYLATGKPIVTTPVPPADRFKDLIYVAHDKFQFVEYLKKALEEDDAELRDRRIKAASDNSWANRADIIINKVSELL